jgi:uncharacterized LabA/DUF88 family protein
MGSVSIFVDAGYLYKQGSGAVLNAKLGRHEVSLDAHKFVEELVGWVCQLYPDDGLLRTYWYDGARQGVPTPDQLDVAALSFVKLRLGRINSSGQQKGVDTLIVRDLMVLSQERSIHRAVVLSGDEDLREGIEYVQDRGVRVAVVGIDAHGDRSQSVELVREADEPGSAASHPDRRPEQEGASDRARTECRGGDAARKRSRQQRGLCIPRGQVRTRLVGQSNRERDRRHRRRSSQDSTGP